MFNPIFYKPLSFLLIICSGYLLKRCGFFQKDDYKIFSKIVLTFTMPCAVIGTFSGFERDAYLFWIVLIGFICSLLPMLAVYLLSFGQETDRRVFSMINTSGYGIGCFSLPLIQGFYGAYSGVITCMFDTGNAVMMTGGSYAITSSLLHLENEGKRKGAWKETVRKFVASVPFDTYMLMLVLTALNIRVPDIVAGIVAPIGAANPYLAMLIVGMMYEPPKKAEYKKDTMTVLFRRFLISAVFALLMFYFTPFSLEVRRTLVVIAFSPVSTLAPIYTEKCHGDGALSSFTNAVSILLALFEMSFLVYIMGV